MKNKLILILIFMTTSFVFSQEDYLILDSTVYNCFYEYKFQVDSTDRGNYNIAYMVLQIGKKKSRFGSENKLFSDSVLYSYKDEEFSSLLVDKIANKLTGRRTHSYSSSIIYKHYPSTNKIFTVNRFNRQYVQVTENSPFKWNTKSKETKTILNHKCNKATVNYGGRKYIAWFTTEIPFNNGPYKFTGLPGLIMQISDTQNHHIFTIKKIQKGKNEPIIFIRDKKIISVSSKDFAKAQQTHNMELYHRIQDNTKYRFNNDKDRIRALDRIKARNNPIERY